jgi:hypothetical protein
MDGRIKSGHDEREPKNKTAHLSQGERLSKKLDCFASLAMTNVPSLRGA